jgi:hypothetical protein
MWMSKKSETNLRNKFSSFFSGGQRSAVSVRSPPEEFNLDTTTLNVSSILWGILPQQTFPRSDILSFL